MSAMSFQNIFQLDPDFELYQFSQQPSSHIGLGPKDLFKNPISKYSLILWDRELGLQHMNLSGPQFSP